MESDQRNYKILIVDDEEPIQQMLEEVLDMESYTTFAASNGADAWEIFKKEQCDLIISDIEMPGTTGIDLLLRVREIRPDIPVIIFTGKPSVEAAVECMKLGANDYIMKPIDIATFLAVVAKTLSEAAAADHGVDPLSNSTWSGYRSIADYKIESKIGEGNKGIVFLATRLHDNEAKKYALKILRLYELSNRDRDHAIERFVREAEIAAAIKHPHVVDIVDYDTTDREEIPYIVMEFIPGRTLGDYQREVPLTVSQKTAIIRQIADALHAIHRHGICHRDIKPGNIMVDDNMHAKVADFGIAKLPESNLTLTGDIVGTPYYLSPEGFASNNVDPRSDIFSLGVVAYELLLGQRPYSAESIFQLAHMMSSTLPVSPTVLDPNLPEGLVHILAKLLKKNPDERYPTAMAIIDDLDLYIAGNGTAILSASSPADWA